MKKKRSFTDRELRVLHDTAEEQQEKMRGGSLWRNFDFLIYILVVVMLAFGVRHFLLEPIRVDGDSMYPTLFDGELMLVEKLAYWREAPQRGDVVICFYPGYVESCVKRVIALPGERIKVSGGKVYINDVPLQEEAYWRETMSYDMNEVVVAPESVFVMGDNRDFSKDSRASDVGAIPYSEVVGHVLYVIWPADFIRAIKRVTY